MKQEGHSPKGTPFYCCQEFIYRKGRISMNYTYILTCADGTFYCGWTNDLDKRLKVHNQGKEPSIPNPDVRWCCPIMRNLRQNRKP